jgi:pimeloyl-ACP methyl ester carboxylesterase
MLLLALCCVAVLFEAALVRAEDFGPGFKTQAVAVDGGVVSVTLGGSGPPVLLLHGYAETSRMWKPLANELAPRFTIIAPDLPGIGGFSGERSRWVRRSAQKRGSPPRT